MTAAIKVGRVSAEADLTQFCQVQYPRLVGTLALYCGDRFVAEELAQETLARVCAQWSRVSDMSAPAGWTHRVAINLANSRFRRMAAERRARARAQSRSTEVEHPADLADAVAIRAAVSRLPIRQRTALVLRYYADLPVDQVASHLHISAGAVHQLTHRALESGQRARLYLLDLPAGMPAKTLAIAFTSSNQDFDELLTDAELIVDSFEFRAP